MTDWRVLRVGLMLVAIFGLGILTGHFLSPRMPAAVSAPARAPAGGRPFDGTKVLNRLDALLDLSSDQRTRILPITRDWGQAAQPLPPMSRARWDLFEEYAPKIRGELTPDQAKDYDHLVEAARAQFRRKFPNYRPKTR
jgi:hypothetical protein